MKRFNALILGVTCAFAVTSLASITTLAETVTKEIALDSVDVVVNGRTIKETNIVYDDHTYVPLRAISESIGCKVDWDEATQTASIAGDVEVPPELIKTFDTYDEEYQALKSQYDVLIASQQEKGNDKEVTRLQNEFTSKTNELKEKYEKANNQAAPILNVQAKEIELGAITVAVNGNTINETNILYDDHTYVPLRAISDSLGCKVVWDEATRSAYITGVLVQKAGEQQEVYTSYDEEYAALKERYDKLIADQIALGDQASQQVIDTGAEQVDEADAPVDPVKKVTEVDAQQYYDAAEKLKKEFNQKIEDLKVKYKVAESTTE